MATQKPSTQVPRKATTATKVAMKPKVAAKKKAAASKPKATEKNKPAAKKKLGRPKMAHTTEEWKTEQHRLFRLSSRASLVAPNATRSQIDNAVRSARRRHQREACELGHKAAKRSLRPDLKQRLANLKRTPVAGEKVVVVPCNGTPRLVVLTAVTDEFAVFRTGMLKRAPGSKSRAPFQAVPLKYALLLK